MPFLRKEKLKNEIIGHGGAGFIGTNFIRYWLQRNSDDVIVNFDLLTYAGNLSNLTDIAAHYPKRYKFAQGDILDTALVESILKKERQT